MSLIELRQHESEGIPVKYRVPAILKAPLSGLLQFGEPPLHQPALRGPPRQGLEVGNGTARRRRTRVSVGRQLQLLHGDLGCRSVEVLDEYVSYARSLLAHCPQRRPIAVEIGIYDAAERSYSGLASLTRRLASRRSPVGSAPCLIACLSVSARRLASASDRLSPTSNRRRSPFELRILSDQYRPPRLMRTRRPGKRPSPSSTTSSSRGRTASSRFAVKG